MFIRIPLKQWVLIYGNAISMVEKNIGILIFAFIHNFIFIHCFINESPFVKNIDFKSSAFVKRFTLRCILKLCCCLTHSISKAS